jgi:hypothetical protein
MQEVARREAEAEALRLLSLEVYEAWAHPITLLQEAWVEGVPDP